MTEKLVDQRLKMLSFQDIEWEPHPDRPDLGTRAEHTFANGWRVTLLRGDFSIHMERARRAGKPEVFEMIAWPPDGTDELPEACASDPLLGDADEMQRMLNAVEQQ